MPCGRPVSPTREASESTTASARTPQVLASCWSIFWKVVGKMKWSICAASTFASASAAFTARGTSLVMPSSRTQRSSQA
ncbi:hypothetical protein FQZ97_1047370 [compost metagenome]